MRREFINCDQKIPIDGDDEVSNTKLFLPTPSGQHDKELAMQYEEKGESETVFRSICSDES